MESEVGPSLQKPLSFLELLIVATTGERDPAADPFAGVASTLVLDE